MTRHASAAPWVLMGLIELAALTATGASQRPERGA